MKYWFSVLLAGWMSVAHAGLFGDDELLPPDEAFAFSASVAANGHIRADWKIADGYYLYKDKFRFSAGDNGATLGEADFPPARVKQDEIFGKVETYRNKVSIDIPVTRQPGTGNQLSFTATYQGCADMGVCYPPQTKTVSLQLPDTPAPAGTSASANSPLSALNALGADFGFNDDSELLPPDEAFRPDVLVRNPDHIAVSWVIAEGYYLYRDKFEFALEPVEGVMLKPVQMPEGEHKNDEFFGDIQVFHEVVDVELGLQREAGPATPVTLLLKYQGCAEAGVCYPPISKRIELMLPPAVGRSVAATPADAAPVETAPAAPLNEQDAIARRLAAGNMIATLLAFFGFGLLLSLTPCVFPMIPILSSIIVGHGSSITVRKSFILSLVYVLAMAATYTLAGVVAGLFGENLQAAFQNTWVLASFAVVFVLLSFSMFGFYELQMPSSIQNRLSSVSNRQQGGSLTGVAIMGFLSALIVGPCVAAPLAGALIYIGQTGDALLGGLALFTLSLGMGAPLIAIGIGAGKLLPKAGAWMDQVKAVFGVLMLAVAIWLLERILPPSLTMALWSTLLIMSSVYLGALDTLPVEATGWSRLWKGLGLLSLVYGAILLVGAASGSRDPLHPLEGIAAGGSSRTTGTQSAHELAFRQIHSLADLQRELDAAARDGKPVMIDFYADWCISCKEMEKYTFGDARVQQALEGFVLLQADVTENNADDKALLKHFGLFGPPGILFFDASGRERPELSVVGYKKVDEFLQVIKSVKSR